MPRKIAVLIVILSLCAIIFAIYDNQMRSIEQHISQLNSSGDKILYVPRIDHSFYDKTTPDESIDEKSSPNKLGEVIPSEFLDDGITSKAYLVGNIRTGEIYISHNGRMALPIASMSKLLTAYVGIEILSPTTTIEITKENTEVYPDQSNLQEGEKFTFDEILYPLLLNSSNVAAEAIATNYGRTDFLELMSGYSWEIGLPTSYFSDPSGLSPQNRSSAKGFFELAKYIYETRRELFTITRTVEREVSTTTEHGYHKFTNIHPFANDKRFLGGKTGRTPEAGDTMLTILKIDNEPIAFIVLGGAYDKRKSDTDMLIEKFNTLIPTL